MCQTFNQRLEWLRVPSSALRYFCAVYAKKFHGKLFGWLMMLLVFIDWDSVFDLIIDSEIFQFVFIGIS